VASTAVGAVLLTGGSGLLGGELRALMPELVAPSHAELDVTDRVSVEAALVRARPVTLVHSAAYTDVREAERDRAACWRTNVLGTRNVVAGAREIGARLVFISTDYVFYGDRGDYREDDPPGPVRNYYALSKLAAEEVARTLPGTLVVRTSFRPRAWPSPTAFEDLFTSQDYVDVIAPELALLLVHLAEVRDATLHIATERKSVLELARRRRPDVLAGRKAAAGVDLPDDVSLNTGRWRAWKARWRA